jgi:subtilisin family serine protease
MWDFVARLLFLLSLLIIAACGQTTPPLDASDDWPATIEKWDGSWHDYGWIVALETKRGDGANDIERRFVEDFRNSAEGEIATILADTLPGGQPGQPRDFDPPEIVLSQNHREGSNPAFAIFKSKSLHYKLINAYQLQGLSTLESGKLAAATVFQTLRQLPNTRWVEPDLESRILDTAPVFPAGDQMEPWKRLNLQETYDYLASKNVTPREINIAVLDTGVDSVHPALAAAMFENSAEKNGTAGVDDDKNGYIDDIHGIDATLEKGKKDRSPAPQPGSADLGGPGSTCPLASSNPFSRNCGHGTHVAGIIAARTGDSETMAGVCQSCKIISIRVANRVKTKGTEYDGAISDSSQLRAMSYILSLVDPKEPSRLLTNVVNLSLGKYFQSRSMAHLIRRLQEQNVLVVAAAGNDDTDMPSYPAAYPSVVGVCALGSDGEGFGNGFHRGKFGKAIFSNFGEWVDICAPGVDILSTVPSDGTLSLHEIRSGTSQATPFVAGALGLLLSIANLDTTLQADSLVTILQRSANSELVYAAKYNRNLYDRRYPDGESAYYLGAGAVDLLNAARMTLRDTDGKNTSEYRPPVMREPMSGCVMSSTAERAQGLAGVAESLVLLLPTLWAAVRIHRKQKKSGEQNS